MAPTNPPEGLYWRATDRRAEYADAKARRLRASSNHLDHYAEAGVSVSRTLGTAWFCGYEYAYLVSGDVIGAGSDGEPLLNPGTLQVRSGLLTVADANTRTWDGSIAQIWEQGER